MFNRLQTRMLVVFLSMVTLPVIIVGLTIGTWSSNSLEEQSILLQGEITEKVNYEIQTYFDARFQETAFLDNVYGISVASLEQQHAILDNLLSYHQHYQSLILLDANGNELVRSSRTSTIDETMDWQTQDAYLVPLTGENYYSPVHFDEEIREPLFEVAMPLINLRTGNIANVLIATIRFRPIWNLLENIELPFTGDVYVTDDSGRIVAHKNPTYVLQNTVVNIDSSQAQQATGLSGNDVLVVQKSFRLDDIEFSTIVEHSTSEVLAPATRIYQLTIAIIISALIITTLLTLFLTRQITSPIQTVAKAAQAISQGDFSQSVEVSGNDEIASLAHSFDEMRVQLQESISSLQNEILDRKAAEEQVKQMNLDLEKRVEERTQELQIVNQELDNFAYVVSHDLKAPLRGISQLSDWLNSDYSDTIDNEGQEMLALLQTRTQRMNDLIEGILHYSRIGRIKSNKKVIALDSHIRDIIDTIAPPDSITINITTPLPTVEGDETQWTQLFQNLISNAVKYMDKPDGIITIACQDDGKNWQFSVADNGPGISEKYHDKIFQIFQTLTPRDQVESTGIGLTLVKKIVENWGGNITVESAPDKGSTFTFIIPKEL